MIARLMGLRTVSPTTLLELVEQHAVAVFDVNAPSSWTRGHVPGARHLDPVAFTPADLPADKTGTLVFYCSNPLCTKAPSAAKRAEFLGYSDVRVLSAGIKGWVDAGMPVERD